MKKIISIFLTLAMILSMSVPAFATSANGVDEQRVLAVYEIFPEAKVIVEAYRNNYVPNGEEPFEVYNDFKSVLEIGGYAEYQVSVLNNGTVDFSKLFVPQTQLTHGIQRASGTSSMDGGIIHTSRYILNGNYSIAAINNVRLTINRNGYDTIDGYDTFAPVTVFPNAFGEGGYQAITYANNTLTKTREDANGGAYVQFEGSGHYLMLSVGGNRWTFTFLG